MGNAITRALAQVGLWANESPQSGLNMYDGRWWGEHGAGIRGDDSGQAVNDESLLQLDVVAAVLERLGGTISALPMMVFERTGPTTRRPAPEHPLYKLLHDEANWRVCAQEFRDEQQRHLTLWRNAYSRIVPDPETGAPIGSLEIIHPRRVQKVAMGSDGRVYYTIRKIDGSGQPEVLRDDDIWHIRKAPLTDDGLCGRPVWETSRKTFAYAQAVNQFGSLYFKNGGTGGGIIKHPSNFKTKADEEAFLDSWRSSGSGLNRHKDRMMKFGLDYTPFVVRNDEAQFIESRKGANQGVCRVFNVPPHMAGILDNATFSNIEQQSIEFVVYSLAPYICAWEQAAGRDLLIGPDKGRYFVELNVAGLLRGDIKTRYAAFAQGRQWGWFSANDIRRFENLDPIPGGDAYLVPLNMSATGQPGGDGVTDGPQDPEDGTDPADRNDDPENQ